MTGRPRYIRVCPVVTIRSRLLQPAVIANRGASGAEEAQGPRGTARPEAH